MELVGIINQHEFRLLDKPSVLGDRCAVCGMPANNRHHVIFKGIGGLSPKTERRIPLITLCGMGNTSGCHGRVHRRTLFLDWRDGWVYLATKNPTKIDNALEMRGWKPLPGWERIKHGF